MFPSTRRTGREQSLHGTSAPVVSDAAASLRAALAGLYDLEGELGAGGMAVVYAARDLRHRRAVAIKVLRPELAAALGTQRFLREIETSASLRHPGIVPLFDSGDADGLLYYVMPLVEGETLRARLERDGRLPVEDALRIASQVADALAYAHDRGIVHRDVKPENILLEDGRAVVTDFGIARCLDGVGASGFATTGLAMGTPAYMSPEQVAGETALDGRADLYGLACVLYEMLTGRPPFTGGSMARLAVQHLAETPTPVNVLRPAVPAGVAAAIGRALAKAPEDRFATTTGFARALTMPAPVPVERQSVAVLPFLSLSSDPENEYFADGITEDVIAQLSKIRALKVVSRTSVMPFRTRELGLPEIASRLNVATLLDGSVRRAGSRVRIVAQLVDARTDQPVWTDTYDRDLTDIFAIQSEVALRIAEALEAELSPAERSRIDGRPPTDPRAYQLVLQGRHHYIRFSSESLNRSIQYFREAIALDPAYAPAWSGLAMALTELGEQGLMPPDEAFPRAREAATRAVSLDAELAAAHVTASHVRMVYDFDWTGAEEGFQRALELSPNAADAYDLYGRLCSALTRFDEAIDLLTRAQELDPLAHRNDVATAYLRAGRYEEALELAGRSAEFAPEDARAQATLGWTYLRLGRREEGLRHLEQAVSLSRFGPGWWAQLGQAYGLHGEPEKARAILATLLDRSRTDYVSPYHLAYIHTGLGEHDRAMDCLEKAFEERTGAMYGVKGSFLFEPLRSHPRFEALLARMNL